jgi:undecaprenyl-diphosphatase
MIMKKEVILNKKNVILFFCLVFLGLISFFIDNQINNLFLDIPKINFISNSLIFLNNWIFLGILSFLSVLFFYFYVDKKKGINIFFSYFLALVLSAVLKICISRPRPGILLDTTSFPSAHAAFVFAPILIFRGKTQKIAIVFALIISLSRIYLVHHYLSDVLFGIILGLICGFLSLNLFEKIKRKSEKEK